MQSLFMIALMAVWLGGALWRVYKQARFYQIEEYKSNRYLRWWVRERQRLIPARTLGAFVVGVAMAIIFSEAPGSILPALVGIGAALVAVWPPDEGEIKKAFNPTQRAQRLLGASFFTTTVIFAALVALMAALEISDYELQVVGVAVVGVAVFLGAPLWLAVGNLLMTPVEATLRGRFVASARAVMDELQPRVVGITGSYGKTTTKNFVSEILNGRYKAYHTPKSYNTMMGVCIAINNDLKHDYSVDYFIVEMGAYIQGEIARIADLTPPDISIVTEIGPQHLERFGTVENIREAKYEIIKALPSHGLGVFNWDNLYVREMYERGYPSQRIAVSKELDPADAPADGPRFIATDIDETLDSLTFTVHDRQTAEKADFVAPVLGLHNVTNILLATAVAVNEGMPLRDVAFRVRTLQPAESRLVRQTTTTGITIINDAYSANPAGVVSSLRVLGMHNGGRRLLVTPGMVELGDMHERENQRLGQIAAQYATDVILVGKEQTQPVYNGLIAADFPLERLQVVDELREAMDWYQSNLQSGDTVLFLNDLPDTY